MTPSDLADAFRAAREFGGKPIQPKGPVTVTEEDGLVYVTCENRHLVASPRWFRLLDEHFQ